MENRYNYDIILKLKYLFNFRWFSLDNNKKCGETVFGKFHHGLNFQVHKLQQQQQRFKCKEGQDWKSFFHSVLNFAMLM